jgi:hypothetical protein
MPQPLTTEREVDNRIVTNSPPQKKGSGKNNTTQLTLLILSIIHVKFFTVNIFKLCVLKLIFFSY